MGSQQFCLKWNNHQSNMLAVFEQLLSNEALVDVTLACEGLSLKAHKMVLSACSPFFQALFVENPCKHPIVIMKDMRYVDLKAIVEFMYRGEVNVSQDQLSALLKTAETLKVKGLAEVTGENKHGALVSVDGADPKPVGTPRAESPPLSKRKRGRPRRRSPSDSNKSDSEDQGGPPTTRIKGPESPEIIEDGSMSSDRVTALPAASPSSRTSSTVAVSSTAVPSGAHIGSTAKATNSLATSQHTQDSIGDDVGEGDDADFEVEPSNLMEQSMTTENVPVFTDVASSSQALGNESQQSHHTGSTSDSTALVPVQASLPSDISISSQVDVKPSPSSLIPFDDQAISPVVAAPPAAAASSAEGANMAMMFMDTSGVPAIAGPSNYHPDKQQSTPSHGHSAAFLDIDNQPNDMGSVGVKEHATKKRSDSVHNQEATIKLEGEGHILAAPAMAELSGGRQKCTFCGKAFTKLKQHMLIHTGERPFQCHLCPMAFNQQSNLTVHLRTHTGEKPFKCHICQKGFTQKRGLSEHLCTHTGERPFKCHICQRGFAQKCALRNHLRIHTGERPFQCHLCPRAFNHQGNLTVHLHTHTAKRPFKCHICQKGFTQKQALRDHLHSHSGERPFQCRVCHKGFTQKGTLIDHLRIHTDDKPYKCHLCNLAFTWRTALARHLKSHGGATTTAPH